MNRTQKDQLKTRIQDEIHTLRQHISSLGDSTGPVAPDEAIGRLSRLDTMLNQGINESAVSQAKLRILKLEAALLRLESDPDFGECVECGVTIPVARLLALPESQLCVECAD